jgi:hypothetical protein
MATAERHRAITPLCVRPGFPRAAGSDVTRCQRPAETARVCDHPSACFSDAFPGVCMRSADDWRSPA